MVHVVGSGKKRVKLITLMNLTILKVSVTNLTFLLSFGFWKEYNNALFLQGLQVSVSINHHENAKIFFSKNWVSFEWMQFIFGIASWT